MDRGFSGYFEKLEIIRAFACLHLIGERRGRSSPMRDPLTTRFLHLDALSAMLRRRWAGRPGLRGRTRRMGGQEPLRPPPLSGVPDLDGLLGGASPDLVGAAPRDVLGAAGAGELVQHGHLRAGSSRTMWWTRLEPMTPKPPATIMRRSSKSSIMRAPTSKPNSRRDHRTHPP